MKFKIGDVVRVKSFEQIKKEFPKLEANGVCFCTHEGRYDMLKFCGKLVTSKKHSLEGLLTIEESKGGCNWTDDFLEPFDGYQIGDTVWTVKRGKCVVHQVRRNTWGAPMELRPFWIKDVLGNNYHPKLSNLIPTEAKYKEAMTGGFQVDVAFVTPYNPTPDSRLPLGKLRWYTDDEIKVNDAVLYRGKKWTVEQITRKIQPIILPEDYVIRRSDHMGGYKAVVSREDISLWKESKCHTRTDAGKLLCVADQPNAEGNRLRTSKFAVGEKVLYCCKTALVTKITYKDDKFTYCLNSNSFPDNIGEESLWAWDTPSHKFKVGDVVFYNGQKWEVAGIKQRADNPCLLPHIKYDIHRQVTPNGGVGACVNESDLRLWKETKITHVDNCDPISSYGNINNDKSAMSKLKYIGKHLNGKDMFLQDAGNGKSVLWYGEKGDDC